MDVAPRLPAAISACLFDLDGVLTRVDGYAGFLRFVEASRDAAQRRAVVLGELLERR